MITRGEKKNLGETIGHIFPLEHQILRGNKSGNAFYREIHWDPGSGLPFRREMLLDHVSSCGFCHLTQGTLDVA